MSQHDPTHDHRHDAAEGKHIACDAVVPGCAFTASAATEEELLRKVAEHAAQAHGVAEVSPELAAQVRAAIRSR